MARSNIDGTLDCVTSPETTQDQKQTESGEAEAEPARSRDEVEASTAPRELESAEFRSTFSKEEPRPESELVLSKSRNGDALRIEPEASEPKMTWEEVEDEWFEFGSDFMIF